MVYDCFIFFNEIELLEIRLNELNDVVDYFVLVESTKTFTYNDKPLFYSENKHLFKYFEHKIIHVVVDDFKSEANTWANEFFQRNCIMRGLSKCNDDDIVMLSDLDEIPKSSEVQKIKDNFSDSNIYSFLHRLYYYYINVFDTDSWKGTKLCSYKTLKEITPQDLRLKEYPSTITIRNAGWHFSYVGGKERIKYKIESFAHFEVNNDSVKNAIEDNVLNLKSLYHQHSNYSLVEIDLSYPKYILDNIEKFNHLIKTK